MESGIMLSDGNILILGGLVWPIYKRKLRPLQRGPSYLVGRSDQILLCGEIIRANYYTYSVTNSRFFPTKNSKIKFTLKILVPSTEDVLFHSSSVLITSVVFSLK